MNILKFLIALILSSSMLLLMNPRSFYGLVFHEWLGLIIGLLFIIHKIINLKWITGVTVRFFKQMPGRTRVNYLLDYLLLAGMILMIVSGIGISRTIDFAWLKLGGSVRFWREMHTSSSFISLALFGVHLGLHWNWVLRTIKLKKVNND